MALLQATNTGESYMGDQKTRGSCAGDPEPQLRSNVTPASNVYRRDPKLPAHRDARFRLEVRGTEAVKQLLHAVAGLINWMQPLSTQEIPVLSASEEDLIRRGEAGASAPFGVTPGQKKEALGLRCSCGRIDFGLKRTADGKLKWGYLWEFGEKCMCQRDDGEVTRR